MSVCSAYLHTYSYANVHLCWYWYRLEFVLSCCNMKQTLQFYDLLRKCPHMIWVPYWYPMKQICYYHFDQYPAKLIIFNIINARWELNTVISILTMWSDMEVAKFWHFSDYFDFDQVPRVKIYSLFALLWSEVVFRVRNTRL